MITGKLVFDRSGMCFVDIPIKVAQDWNLAGILCLSPPEVVAQYNQKPKHKKTCNSFFLYKKAKRAELAEKYPNQREANKIAAELWKQEPEEVKEHYSQLARQLKEKQKAELLEDNEHDEAS